MSIKEFEVIKKECVSSTESTLCLNYSFIKMTLNHLLNTDGRIILQWNLEKYGLKIQIGFI
jgi:hypothetical protein